MIWIPVCVLGAVALRYIAWSVHGFVDRLFGTLAVALAALESRLVSVQEAAKHATGKLFPKPDAREILRAALVAVLLGGGGAVALWAEWQLLSLTIQGMFGGSLVVGQAAAAAYMVTVVGAGFVLLDVLGVHSIVPGLNRKQLPRRTKAAFRLAAIIIFASLVLLSTIAGVWRTWANNADQASTWGDVVWPAAWNGVAMAALTVVAALLSIGLHEALRLAMAAVLGTSLVVMAACTTLVHIVLALWVALGGAVHGLLDIPVALGALIVMCVQSLWPRGSSGGGIESLDIQLGAEPEELEAQADPDLPTLSPDELAALSGEGAEQAEQPGEEVH